MLVSKLPSWEDGSFRWKGRWLLPFFHVSYSLIYDWNCDCSDWGGEEGDQLHRYDSISTTIIYISGPIFVKLYNDFNPSCLSPTFVMKIFFSQWSTCSLKALHQASSYVSIVGWIFYLSHCIYVHFEVVLHIFLVHRLNKVTVCAKIHS